MAPLGQTESTWWATALAAIAAGAGVAARYLLLRGRNGELKKEEPAVNALDTIARSHVASAEHLGLIRESTTDNGKAIARLEGKLASEIAGIREELRRNSEAIQALVASMKKEGGGA